MPCYEGPPPYSEAARRNEKEAVKILCELIGGRVKRGEPLSARLLLWYAEHRMVDLEILREGRTTPTETAEEIVADIEQVRNRLRLATS